MRFHGDLRQKTADGIDSYDVVLTTYQTLAADWKGVRVLHKVTWLRVVLDEGKPLPPFTAQKKRDPDIANS